ncbi:MAG: mechanosensitive ion channel family protein [Acidimicrobiales bacterium]
MLDGVVDPEALEAACGADASFLCRELFERTDSRGMAEAADILFKTPLKIALVLVVARVVVGILHRLIDQFVARLSGQGQPGRRLKRTLRRTPLAATLPSGVFANAEVSVRSSARAETLGHVLRSVSAGAVWSIAVMTVLGELGINLGPLVAGAGIAGVALGFGAQSLVKDFLAGIFIIVEDQYGVGDIIDVGELSGTLVSGTVEAVSLRSTHLRSTNGTVWHVPNGTILRVGNMSQQWARALLDVSVAYGSDLDHAQAVIKAAADEVWQDPDWSHDILEEPELWGVENLAPDGVTIRLVVKTQPAEQFRVLRELRGRIKAALDDAGVEIPTAQRTVWVRREPGAPPLPGEEPELP